MKQVSKLEDIFTTPVARRYKKGNVMLHQGDELTHIYYIKRGYVKAYNITEAGEQRVLILMGPGDAFPLMRSINISKYHLKYFWEAMTDAQLCLADRSQVLKLIKNDHQATKVVLEYLAEKSKELLDRLEMMADKSAMNKVAHLLPYLIRVCGKQLNANLYRLKLKVTHQDIANMTGLARETASIQIKKLEDAGVIRTLAGKLVIRADLVPKFLEVDTDMDSLVEPV